MMLYLDVIPFNTLHTHLSLELGLSPQQVSKNQKSLVKVAQVCWIMDTGDCAGLDFVSSDINGSGNKPPSEYDKKGPEDCIKEGYTITNCPDGQKGDGECMYANGYYAKCIPDCPSSYTNVCMPMATMPNVFPTARHLIPPARRLIKGWGKFAVMVYIPNVVSTHVRRITNTP